MNYKRVILGGLLAGLVLNLGEGVLHGMVIADASAAAMTALGKDINGTALGMSLLVLVTFAQGLVGVALWAAMRERTKARAVAVGCGVWLLSGVYSAIYFYAGYPNLLPDAIVWQPVAWELVQYPLAMVAGAAVYREP